MDIKAGTKKFGKMIEDTVRKDPMKARKLCAMSCDISVIRATLMRGKLSRCRRYQGRVVSRALKKSFTDPENSAMVSIFVPTEPLAAAGLTPVSIEALSGFTTGAMCEQVFLEKAREEGEPETLCSFHRAFHGTMSTGVVPIPRMLIYTNLACDANMIGFPYVEKKFGIPTFFIEVPGKRSEDSVHFVAAQMREMTKFVSDVSGKQITEDALKEAVSKSNRTSRYYLESLNYMGDHAIKSTMEADLYGVFSGHILMGTKEAEKCAKMTLEDLKKAKGNDAIRLVWMHMIPFLQPSLQNAIDNSDRVRVTACDLVYDSMFDVDISDPYYAMAYRMVYSIYNGDYKWRAQRAIKIARQTKADGIALFSHWGCKTTFGATELFAREFEKAGYPMLVIAGDGADSANWNEGQVATRFEAFIEMLEERRRNR